LFYKPLTPDQYNAASGLTTSKSYTENTFYRLQLTNAKLFHLPGGNAGIAFVAEGAHQLWDYIPDPGFQTNKFFGLTSSGASEGNRTRYALTSELRLPVYDKLTVDVSSRYDVYKLQDNSVSKFTYMAGLEYRPVPTVLLRGRLGTAFKAPTLSDQYQSLSGAYVSGQTDYYRCYKGGYTPDTISDCPVAGNQQLFQQTSGNTKLAPINADVWNAGMVWDVSKAVSLDLDYLHWTIRDEVSLASDDSLLQQEARCRLGDLDIKSPTCVAALNQVTRNGDGTITAVYVPKVNVANETVNAFTAKVHYKMPTQSLGQFEYSLTWTDMIAHQYQQYPGDPLIDLLRDPTYSTDFKSRMQGEINWSYDKLSSTLFVLREGQTPNYVATLRGYDSTGAGNLNPFYMVNLSASYTWNDNLNVSARVTNLFNRMPPEDRSYNGLTSSPYNIFNYDVYGRAAQIEVTYKTK